MAVYSLSPGFLQGVWKATNDAYLEDRVAAAYQMIEEAATGSVGSALGFYRLIEGEARTREQSQQSVLNQWLTLEWIPSEIPHHQAVGQVVLEAVTRVGKRLNWDHREKVMATILTAEADALWNEARYGYCVDKVPYDKICLPWAACQDPNELFRVASHEFAHVVVLNSALAKAPHWLDEGIACLMEGRSPSRAKQRLDHAGIWLDSSALERTYGVDRRETANMGSVGAAYDQATVIAGFLHGQKGDAGIVQLLGGFAKQPVLTELFNRIRNHDQSEQPLQHVFGFGESELFERARDWQPSP